MVAVELDGRDYFLQTIHGGDILFVFLLQLEMIERWISLDKEKGSQLFRIIAALKDRSTDTRRIQIKPST